MQAGNLLVLQRHVENLLMVVALFHHVVETTRIVEQPQDQVIFTSYDEPNVQYSCTFESTGVTIISWKVNGTSTTFSSSQTFNGNTGTSTLTFPALIAYNGTRVECTGRGLTSEQVWFMYQGLLDMPDEVRADSNSSSVRISWTAPFSLDVTGVEPDVWYSVIIYNVTDENNPTTVTCTDCTDIVGTNYTFTAHYPNPCHIYNFSIIPFNGAGQGESSHGLLASITGAPPNLKVITTEIEEKSSHLYGIVIQAATVHRGKVLCHGEFPTTVVLYYTSAVNTCPSPVVSNVVPEGTSVNEWLITSEVTLGENCEYTLHLTSRNRAGDTNSTSTVSFSTRVVSVEVQKIEEEEEEVVVKCIFRQTLSRSCYVQLISDVGRGFHKGRCVDGEMVESGEGVARFSRLPQATYTVLVYGLTEKNSSCSFSGGDPDYITVITFDKHHLTSTVSTVFSSDTTGLQVSRAPPLCAEGIGVGVCLGIAVTCLLFVFGLVTIKVILKMKRRSRDGKSRGVPTRKVTMERNAAYELHKPPSLKKGATPPPPRPLSAQNHIYDDLK